MVEFELKALVIVPDDEVANSILSVLHKRDVRKLFHANCTQNAICAMVETQFNLVVIDGCVSVAPDKEYITDAGVDFIRFIRMCEGPVSEAIIVYLRCDHKHQNLVEASSEISDAQNAGANIILSRPFTIEKFDNDVAPHVLNPRQFVKTIRYTGPCRRKRKKAVVVEKRRMINDSYERITLPPL